MKENFDASFTELMGIEGGYSSNPADPGGETMWGITERVARKHGYVGAMRDLPQSLAKQIAKTEYWDVCNCDQISDGLDFQVFDASYNSGTARAMEWYDKAIANTVRDPFQVIIRFDAYRLLYLDSLPTWPSFGRGWVKRVANNLLRAAQ